MTPKSDAKEDRRATDQDSAVEKAFVAGMLPEEDRREDRRSGDKETATEEAFVTGSLPEEDRRGGIGDTGDERSGLERLLDDAGPGSVFEKTHSGWKVRYVDGGTVIAVEGATITLAIASHGKQVEHT